MDLTTSANGLVPCRGAEAYAIRVEELILFCKRIANQNQPTRQYLRKKDIQ